MGMKTLRFRAGASARLRPDPALRVARGAMTRLGGLLLLAGIGMTGAAQAQSCGVGETPAAGVTLKGGGVGPAVIAGPDWLKV